MSLEDVSAQGDRVAERLQQFQLTTAAPEMGPRLCQAGHEPALAVIAEVLNLEAEARQQRRIARSPSAPSVRTIPPGKVGSALPLGSKLSDSVFTTPVGFVREATRPARIVDAGHP